MSDQSGILASFDYLDSTIDAVKELREAGFDPTTYSSYPEHHLEDALGYGQSPVRVWTLVGGLTGTATGFAFTAWTSMDWPLITGGKPVLSMPAYVVIAFEMTILFGALSTVLGMFINSRLPNVTPAVIYDPEFSAGRYGIFVSASGTDLDRAREILRKHDPEETREGAHA
jgi:hypothetical protein